MGPELWQRADLIFQDAVELAPSVRRAFLDKACGHDQALRGEVDSLLEADLFEWELIETPALESAAWLLFDEPPQFEQGQKVGGYEIVDLLGKGGMGEVYLAKDHTLNRSVALKALPIDYTSDKDHLSRFQREARAASALNHPNILTVYQLGEFDGHTFIATEFVEGETLRSHIARGPMVLAAAIDTAIQIAGALAAAHKAGIVHRDIKPENIMLRPDGYVKVLDFGLAKLAESRRIDDARSIDTPSEPVELSSALLMGTPRYMSPEQAGGQRVDARSDLFSFGVVLFEMITGQPPFNSKDRVQLVESILLTEPPPLGDFVDIVPQRLEHVITTCLRKKKEDRYPNADHLLGDLKLLKNDLDADPAVSFPRVSSIRTGRRRMFAIALTILVSASALIGYATYRYFASPATDNTAAVSTGDQKGTWTTKAPISSARWFAEPAVLNDTLYVVGGWNVCTPFGDLESYDPESDTWRRHAMMLTPRGSHGVGVVDGKIYAVGGQTGCGHPTASVEAYDPASDTWSPMAPLPAVRSDHVVAVASGKLYAIGGTATGGTPIGSNFQYDPVTAKWTKRAPIPTSRKAATAAVVNEIIYVIGGNSGTKNLATVEAYDPVADSWTTKSSMLSARVNFAVAELDGILYAFGGNTSGRVEAYDPVDDIWTVVAEMPARRAFIHGAAFRGSIYIAGGSDMVDHLSSVTAFTPARAATFPAASCPSVQVMARAPLPTTRTGMAAGEIDGLIYAVGGYNEKSRFLSVNEVYDPAADKWTTRTPMPVAREMRASTNAVVNEKLYVIGGNANGYCSDLNQAYDPKTDSWSTLAPMPTPRCHLAVTVLDGLIYAIGGTNTNGSIMYAVVEVYDPATDTWTSAPEMPTGRYDLGAVTLNGKLYAVGGANPAVNPDALDVVEIYDPVSKIWTTKAPMSTPRGSMAIGVRDGLVVAIGGVSNGERLAAVEAYDSVSDRWTRLKSMPTARGTAVAIAASSTIYIMGGASASQEATVTNEAVNIVPCPE